MKRLCIIVLSSGTCDGLSLLLLLLCPPGNDFSTLYAPLIRDGRMEKYYWNPTREDRIGVCMGIFMDDNLNR
jgi:hypothetical protein